MSYDAAGKSAAELLRDWAAVIRALRELDVIRTNNNPVGDIAEAVVHAHFGGERASFAQAGWDVKTDENELLQVKGMRRTATNKRTNLSPIRDEAYDSVVIVVFDEDFLITHGYKVDRFVIEERFEVTEHVNGRIIRLTAAFCDDARVQAVDLSDAYAKLHA